LREPRARFGPTSAPLDEKDALLPGVRALLPELGALLPRMAAALAPKDPSTRLATAPHPLDDEGTAQA
jgi:hypothetical protein